MTSQVRGEGRMHAAMLAWLAGGLQNVRELIRRSANDCKTSRFDKHARLVYACDGTSYLPTRDMAWSSFSHVLWYD